MTKGILLDTHIVLWMRADPARLTEPERQVIDAAPMRYVSAVTFWEFALLVNLGRIDNDPRLFDLPHGLDLLPVQPDHCRELVSLPMIHRDPFDRMLIAQARVESLVLVTRDAKITGYGGAGCATADMGLGALTDP